MSTEYSTPVQWTEFGQGPIPDEQREGRWQFSHTSDTCTWQWRFVNVGAGPWIDGLTVSKEHFAALITAATTQENENDPQPQV